MKHLLTFASVRGGDFITDIKQQLTLDNLIETARPVPEDASGTRISRIYFCGTRGWYLLGSRTNRSILNVFKEFSNVLSNLDEFTKNKVMLKLRFLLTYPFSSHSYTRIVAETNTMRSSIYDHDDSPDYYDKHPDLLFKPHAITEFDLLTSCLYTDQISSVRCLKELLDYFQLLDSKTHKAAIRFTALSLNASTTIINNVAYIIPYLLGKDHRGDPYCTQQRPVIKINRASHATNFKAASDHMKYIWNRPHTLDFLDAFEVNEHRFKMPHEIDFKFKKQRIKQRLGSNITETELEHQRIRIESLFLKYCIVPPKKPETNSLFIALSWAIEIDNTLVFNKDGDDVVKWLKEDFKDFENLLEIDIFRGVIFQSIQELFQSMNKSSYGLIIMTADLNCKPVNDLNAPDISCPKSNVSLELGYMMRHLIADRSQEPQKRLYLINETGIDTNKVLSDLSGFIKGAPFDKNEIILRYSDIIDWIFSKIEFPQTHKKVVFNNIIRRIESIITDPSKSRVAIRKIQGAITQLTIA